MTTHTVDHDPILDEVVRHECAVCHAAFSSTMAALHEILPGLGPADGDEFIRRLQDEAKVRMRLVEST